MKIEATPNRFDDIKMPKFLGKNFNFMRIGFACMEDALKELSLDGKYEEIHCVIANMRLLRQFFNGEHITKEFNDWEKAAKNYIKKQKAA